jgi:hypothetical protein
MFRRVEPRIGRGTVFAIVGAGAVAAVIVTLTSPHLGPSVRTGPDLQNASQPLHSNLGSSPQRPAVMPAGDGPPGGGTASQGALVPQASQAAVGNTAAHSAAPTTTSAAPSPSSPAPSASPTPSPSDSATCLPQPTQNTTVCGFVATPSPNP